MKAFIATAVIALSPNVAVADQATYDQYMDKYYQTVFCVGFGDVLQDDYLDEMIEVVGEDTAIEVMDVRSAAMNNMFDIIFVVKDDPSMNKIWKKRFNNNLDMAGQHDGFAHAENSYKAVGIEATVTSFLERCKK